MSGFLEYIKSHRVLSGIVAGAVVIILIIGGSVIYANTLPDAPSESPSTTTTTELTSTTQNSETTTTASGDQSALSSSSSTTTTTTIAKTATSAASPSTNTIRSITVTSYTASPDSNFPANSTWPFPLSAHVTMSSGVNIPLTYTFILADGTKKIVQSSTGDATATWDLPHCTNGKYKVTVTGAGTPRTSSVASVNWTDC